MSGQSRCPGVWPTPIALHHLRERASARFHCLIRPRSTRSPTSDKSGKPLFVSVWMRLYEDEIRSVEGIEYARTESATRLAPVSLTRVSPWKF